MNLKTAGAAVLIAVLLLALGHVAAAQAASVSINGPWWAQRAVSRMHVPVLPGQTVILGPCPGWNPDTVTACNFPTPDSPIYVQRRFYSRQLLARELGGRFGTLVMTPAAEQRFAQIIHSREAWDMAVAGGHAYGLHDTFEDAYANCALGIRRHRPTLQDPGTNWIDETGYEPTPRQHRRVCSLIGWMGASVGLMAPGS